ncbi:MAG: VTT domain-containing protein [Erysipelotrichaceae bacterium]|nr:VTT domain-containing protein [Erysipelotrichaceae bacterium]
MNKESSLTVKITVAAILILFTLFSVYIGRSLLKFIHDPELFRAWIDSYGIYAPLAYGGITVLQILVPLIPGEPMEMIAGYAFGSLQGTIYCILAESLGSILVLLIVKRYGRKVVEIFFEKEKIDSLRFLRSDKNRILLFALIFIVPGTPKDLLCYLAGLTAIDAKILIPIITLGRFPSIITSTLAGDHLGDQKYITAAVYIGAALLLSAIGVVVYRRIKNRDHDRS